jgi:hypothetical protein
MNEREVATAAYDRASTALAETQAELKEAKRVVTGWRKLKSDEDWDNATSSYKRKTIEQWEQEVAELKEKENDAKQREKEARAAFMAVTHGQPQGVLY